MQKAKQDLLRARFTIWLKRVIVNARIDYLRQLNSVDKFLYDECDEDVFRQDFSFELKKEKFDFDNEEISRAIYKLSKQRQYVLIKTYINNKSFEEIAKELSVTVQHVYNQHSLAIKQLKSILSKGKNNEKY